MRSTETRSAGCSTTQTTVPVAARVDADLAALGLGQVAALGAEADPLLHLANGVGERERVLGRGLEQVEREPLGRSGADAR